MTDSSITRRAALLSAAGIAVATASTNAALSAADAPAAPFDPERVVDQIAAIEDYGEQLALLKRFSALMRIQFNWMLIRDYDVSGAISVLQAHQDTEHLYHFGDLPHYTKDAELNLLEALSGEELRPRILRVNIDVDEDVKAG